MTKTLDIKLRYRPTQEQLTAIEHFHKIQQRTEVYAGEWTIADTVRYLLSRPFVANDYPVDIQRVPSKTVNGSRSFVESLSPAMDKESSCAHLYRLLSSGLVQMGYLKVTQVNKQREKR